MFKWVIKKIEKEVEKRKQTQIQEIISSAEKQINEIKEEQELLVDKLRIQKDLYAYEVNEYKQKRDLIEKEYSDLKVKHEQRCNDLREQIKLIEAKSSPDQVWITAFNTGVSKAWDMIKDTYSVVNNDIVRGLVKETEDKTMSSVNEIVKTRVVSLKNKTMKNLVLIEEKIKEFELKKLEAERLDDKVSALKYSNYLALLNWVVNNEKTD